MTLREKDNIMVAGVKKKHLINKMKEGMEELCSGPVMGDDGLHCRGCVDLRDNMMSRIEEDIQKAQAEEIDYILLQDIT